jgi:integrase
MKLDALLSEYRKHQILQPKTFCNYEQVVESFAKFIGRNPKLEELTVDMMLDYRQDILSRCTAITFNNYRRHLCALFNFAVKRGSMAENPFRDVKSAPTPQRKPKTIRIALLQEIIDYLSKSGDKYDETESVQIGITPRWFWLVAVKTLYYSAIRRKQLVELRLKDIDFEKKVIRLRTEGSKTLREWDIPLPEPLSDDLRYLYDRVIETIGRYNGEQQLFCYPLLSKHRFSKSREMTVGHVSQMFRKLTKLFELPISAHRIRHTTATEMARNTENIRLVQEILGHTDLRTTFIYVQPDFGSMRHLMGGMTKLVNAL